MSILKKLVSVFSGMSPAPVELDIAPTVKPVAESKPTNVATTLEDARRRHGRAFKAQQKIPRHESASESLDRLNRLSAEAAGKTIVVTDINSWRQK